MSNDELAILAKDDQDALLQLWGQTRPFALKLVWKYAPLLKRNRAFDIEDLVSLAFMGFHDAVLRFDADRGGFLTMMKFRVMSQIARSLGIERKKAIENAAVIVSLNAAPFGADDENMALEETIPDPDAPDPEAETVLVMMCEDVEDAVNRLSKRQQQAIRAFYWANRTMQEIAESMGITRGGVNSLITDARRKLRRDEVLRGYVPNYYRPGSVQRFMSSWTSSVEEEVLRKLAWMDRERAANRQTLAGAAGECVPVGPPSGWEAPGENKLGA